MPNPYREYPTSLQERQLLAVQAFREFPTHADIMPDQEVTEEWFANGGADWDETSLAASLWFNHLNGGLSTGEGR